MKKHCSKFSIKRTSISPYFKESFKRKECEVLSELGTFLEVGSSLPSHILITNTHTQFNELSKAELDELKIIIHPNSGYDNIPSEFVKKTKAPIVIGNTIRAQAVTNYILSNVLSHYSPPLHQETWDKSRKWDRLLLNELKVIIIGYGHIGKLLNTALRPLVKNLHVYDPHENLTDFNYQDADVVIMASSLNQTNYHQINKDFLSKIKKNALIVNTSRGELIDSQALVDFLKNNSESFAVLDVFESEPNDFNLFKDLQNIRLTSHIAGVYKNIDEETLRFEAEVVSDFINLKDIDFKIKYQKMILQNRLKENIGLI